MPIGNTVTVINRSGKVVSTGKHLKGVWEEAKAAYQTRKAEIAAGREHEFQERRARFALEQASLSDGDQQVRRVKRAGSVAGSQSTRRSRHSRADGHHRHGEHGHRRGSHQHELRSPGSDSGSRHGGHHPHHPRPSPLKRGYTDSAFTNDHAHDHPSEPPDSFEAPDRAMVRRNTLPPRPGTADSYDEHLAYGSMPPALPLRPSEAEVQLRGEMSKLTKLLDEANCLQKSATAMVEHLQKNPDALAAVGLTLAEISALVKKVGPIAFMNMKTAFPAVAALLASPQFLIAGGLAVGVTVVMFGGYKIVQRMKANKELVEGEEMEAGEMDELRELEGDLSRIEVWRRGIADAEAESVGTTVEGEFVTPIATQHMLAEGMITQENLKPLPSRGGAKSERSHRQHKADSVRSGTTAKTKKHHSSKSRAAESVAGSTRSRKDKEKGKEKEKEKKFTPMKGLKLLLHGKP